MRFWSLGLATAGLLLAAAGASAQDASPGARHGRSSPYWNHRQSGYDETPAVEPMPGAVEILPADASYDGHGVGGCDGCYGEALSDSGSSCGGCCDSCNSCCGCPWFGSVAGLVMTRDSGNEVFTSYSTTNINDQLMNTQDAELDWAGGFEVRFGRRFGCCCTNAWEVTYWTLDEMEGSASFRREDDTLGTPLNAGFLTIGGDPASDYFDNAREHRISRSSEFHNLEINLIHYPMWNPCESFSVSFLAGARYFRFDDELTFGSVRGGSEFGDNGGADEAYLDVECENNLVGFQLGARADWRLGCRWKLFAAPEVGVYNNHVRNEADIYRGDGAAAVGTIPAPGSGSVLYPLRSNEDDVAILAQLDLGVEYAVNCNWRVFGGYRAVAVTGVALTDNQVPQFMIDQPEWQNIDTNGSLILHGAFGGVECRY